MIKILESRYYHYRISSNRWAQWPMGRPCEPGDCFGWRAIETARLANAAVQPQERNDG